MKKYNNRWRQKAAIVALLATNFQAIQLNNSQKQHIAIKDSDFNIMSVANSEPAKNATAPAAAKVQVAEAPKPDHNNLLQALAAGTIDLDKVSSEDLQQIAMNAGLVGAPTPNVPGAANQQKKDEAPPMPDEVAEHKEAKRKEKTNVQTEQDLENGTQTEISLIENEIKEDEKNVSDMKEKLATAEQTLKDHKELLSKKKDLIRLQEEQSKKKKELENSKDMVEKSDAVKKAMEDVQKAEQKVGQNKGQETKQMAQQNANMESVVAQAIEAVQKSQKAQMDKLTKMLEAKEKADAEKDAKKRTDKHDSKLKKQLAAADNEEKKAKKSLHKKKDKPSSEDKEPKHEATKMAEQEHKKKKHSGEHLQE